MGRFARKYEVEQKRAIVRLILDRGLSPAEAVAWAADGRVEGCSAFVMPKDSARLYASQERHRRERRRRAQVLAKNDCAPRLGIATAGSHMRLVSSRSAFPGDAEPRRRSAGRRSDLRSAASTDVAPGVT